MKSLGGDCMQLKPNQSSCFQTSKSPLPVIATETKIPKPSIIVGELAQTRWQIVPAHFVSQVVHGS